MVLAMQLGALAARGNLTDLLANRAAESAEQSIGDVEIGNSDLVQEKLGSHLRNDGNPDDEIGDHPDKFLSHALGSIATRRLAEMDASPEGESPA